MTRLFNGSTEQFRLFVPVNKNFTLKDVLPTLDSTAENILPRFLGVTVADQICELINGDLTDSTTDAYLTRALKLAQTVVARLGFAAFLPWAEVQIGDDGITVTALVDRKAAFEYQTKKLERQLLESGWQAMDELVKLVAAKPDLFPGWTESESFQEHQAALFKNPVQFSKYYPIQDKWLTFWALRPFISAVEEDRGQPVLESIAGLPDSVPEAKIERLKKTLMRAMAYESVFQAMPNLSVEINGANVQVNYASQYGNATYYQPPSREHIDWVRENLRNQADLAWNMLGTEFESLQPATPESGADALGIIDEGSFLML